MKIRMLSTAAGPQGVVAADAVVNVPDAKAKELIKLGFAAAAAPEDKATAPWPFGDAVAPAEK